VSGAVDAIWDFSASPIELAPGAYWVTAYKDTTGAQTVGWWSPFPATTQRNMGKLSSSSGGWNDLADLDFDVDGEIVDPCPAISSHTILGKSLRIGDPSEGSDPKERAVKILARERLSPDPLVGDPTVDGATLEVVVNGSHPTSQTFSLPEERWSGPEAGRGVSFHYRDLLGEAGPVKRLVVRRSEEGLFVIRVQIDGSRDASQTLALTPPNDGTDAWAVLRIGGGDRYCMKFGTDGTVRNRGARSFQVSNPIAEGCP
jgi:hypothetical protein